MKKSLKVALAAVCFIAAGAFFMGCSSSAGGDFTPKYAVGDIVLNDGTKVAYNVAKGYSGDDLTNLKKNAIAVIFRADTESASALGVGIKQKSDGLKWCIKDAAGYDTKFTDTVCKPDEGTSAPNLTFKNSPNTDGSKNLGKIVRALMKADKNDTHLAADKNLNVTLLEKAYGMLPNEFYQDFKTNYPAFEFAYYYGKNEGHNITIGSVFENGWYLPSLSELNDIFQANKADSVIESALGVTGGDNFDGCWYWSSSQEDEGSGNKYIWVYYLNLYSGQVESTEKDSSDLYTCAIRAFN